MSPIYLKGRSPSRTSGSCPADQVRRNLGDGSFGGHYQAPPEVMEELFNACLGEVVALLEKI